MRKGFSLFLLSASLLLLNYAKATAQYIGIIPQPESIDIGQDSLILSRQLNIHSKETDETIYLRQELLNRFQIYSTANEAKPSLVTFQKFKLNKSNSNKERYELSISSQGIIITAHSDLGYFNAINSLIQLIHYHDIKGQIKLPAVTIKDEPTHPWRGFMLDESRHFFGKQKVKQLLDYMAFYKLNKFHWHLTDEPAWRVEIKQYPFLTLIGGVGSFLNPLAPAQYYSQEDIKEIVAYARDRHIEVIPEIDMPGHATAANRAYPQFSGGGTKDHPDFTFHPAKEGTYTYLTNILKEINVLFPSQMIHLGGDEVAFGSDAWNADKSIQDLKSKMNFSSNKEVETYFMRRMADSLFNMGAKLVVWDEMAEANLPTDKTIQFWWRHDKIQQLDLVLKNGYSAVICPRLPFYFDFVQKDEHRYGRKWGKGFNPLESVYEYDLNALKSKQIREGQILGVQANLWTERVHNTERLDFMVFPRIAALAETAWTQQSRKNFDYFKTVLKRHLNIYKTDKIYFYDPFGDTNAEPRVEASPKKYIDNPE